MIIKLSREEIKACLWAIENHTAANANDIGEMLLEGMSAKQAVNLISANKILRRAIDEQREKKPRCEDAPENEPGFSLR